ncbi:MAG: tetratricopeptide repeat protein, partial [Gammaproteobacteria bacterium]
LCVAYTMLRDFSKASEYCEASVESGWSRGIAFNNRGVMKAARGDYEGAQRDFQSAIEGRGADNVARRNLERARTTLIAQRSKEVTPDGFDGELVAAKTTSSQQ